MAKALEAYEQLHYHYNQPQNSKMFGFRVEVWAHLKRSVWAPSMSVQMGNNSPTRCLSCCQEGIVQSSGFLWAAEFRIIVSAH